MKESEQFMSISAWYRPPIERKKLKSAISIVAANENTTSSVRIDIDNHCYELYRRYISATQNQEALVFKYRWIYIEMV